MEKIIDYRAMGFGGQMNGSDPAYPKVACWKLGSPGAPFLGRNGAIQWVFSDKEEAGSLEALPPADEGQLFLAGLALDSEESPSHLAQRVANILSSGRYDDLASIAEISSGCFVHKDRSIYLWTGYGANIPAFYRKDGSIIRWSTNPLDLVLSSDDLDLLALQCCCYGEDVFVYRNMMMVDQGHLVKIRPDGSVSVHQFDSFAPDVRLLHKRATLWDFVEATMEAVCQAVRPLVGKGRVAIMLSGGSGSVALLVAMVKEGVDVIAYHLDSPDPAGSEFRFAQMACEALGVPLKRIVMDTGPDYLSRRWMLPHPFAHSWGLRWYEQMAEEARKVGATIVINGSGDDSSFGLLPEYSVRAILGANIAWHEKKKMLGGLLATNWSILDIIRSGLPWPWPPQGLVGLTSIWGPSREDKLKWRGDFLTPGDLPRRPDDKNFWRDPCFSPQTMAREQAILWANGIVHYRPYLRRRVQSVSRAIPVAYRIIPGRTLESLVPGLATRVPDLSWIVEKPVLRLAIETFGGTNMSPEVVWRPWSGNAAMSAQTFCVNNPGVLWEVLGPGSRMAEMGFVDVTHLREILASRWLTRDNDKTLVAAAQVGRFLGTSWHEQCSRGGPIWM